MCYHDNIKNCNLYELKTEPPITVNSKHNKTKLNKTKLNKTKHNKLQQQTHSQSTHTHAPLGTASKKPMLIAGVQKNNTPTPSVTSARKAPRLVHQKHSTSSTAPSRLYSVMSCKMASILSRLSRLLSSGWICNSENSGKTTHNRLENTHCAFTPLTWY